MSSTCSCGALGTSTYVCPPSGLAPVACPCVDVDASAPDVPEDRPAPVDAGALDASQVDAGADAGGDDAGQLDAGTDAGAPGPFDAAEDRPDAVDAGADVPTDRPDVVDVLRDTGPVDGGPVVYDLDAARSAESFRVIYRLTIPGGGGGVEDCDTPARATSCSVMGDALRFSLEACGITFTGLLPLSGTSGRVVSLVGGAADPAHSINPPLAAGRIVGGRQSFRVQIANTSTPRMIGVAGIAGRTVDPALGDLWLLGCRVTN
ncbi:MAG: hypothetical protein EPO40_00580 [Myxococcaceae bacterium]|nr:MAG: hypothetical protein EPO40_00580 [Myxococcaceae bacterium]